MNYTSYNAAGVVVNNGSAGGGGNGIPSRSIIAMGTMWNTAFAANTYQNLYIGTVNANNQAVGATGFLYCFERPAAVVGLMFNQAGPITGTNSLQLVKNGSVLATLNMGTNNSGTPAPPMTWPNTTYTFAVGDILACNVANTGTGNAQVSAFATVEWLA